MSEKKQMVSIPRELLEARISHLEWLGNSALAEAANLRALMTQSVDVRRERQAQGIEKAKAAGKYQGRPVDDDLHKRVKELLRAGLGVRPAARHAKCSTTTVLRIRDSASEQPSVPSSSNIESSAPLENHDFKRYTATSTQTAAALGVSERTLRIMANQPGFSAAIRINQRVIRYDLEAAQAFYFRQQENERAASNDATAINRGKSGTRFADSGGSSFQWTDEQLAKIGTMPDAALGAEIGLSLSVVWSKRRKLGIKSFLEGKVDSKWSSSQIALLGTMSDQAVAEKLGKTREAITDIRNRLGIPSNRKNRSKQIQGGAGRHEKNG